MKMTSTSGKQYGLLIRKKKQPQISSKSVFDDSGDEIESKKVEKLIVKESARNQVKRQTQVEIQKALEADPTVYEYDNVYDDIQKKKEIAKEALVPKEKKARYIQSLLKSAEQRKKDNERRIERQIQKERQEEGEKYADKEAFVTTAYKMKMQEMMEEEEREERERQIEELMDVRKQNDLSGFYRHFLNQATGEEAIPEFGKRFSATSSAPLIKVEKESSTHDESNEVKTESQSVGTARNKAKEALLELKASTCIINEESRVDLPRDSTANVRLEKDVYADDSSSLESKTPCTSQNSGHASKDNFKKLSQKTRERHKKLSGRTRRKHKASDSDSDLSSDSSSSKAVTPKKDRNSSSSDSSDSPKKRPKRYDSSSESETEFTKTGLQTTAPDYAKTSSEDREIEDAGIKQYSEDNGSNTSVASIKKRKEIIYEKRTVGHLFIEAKARYLARKEARENAKRIFSSA